MADEIEAGTERGDALAWLRRPEIREQAAAGRGLVILDDALEHVAWANGAGARLLGATDPSALREAVPEAGQALLRQAKGAARRAREQHEPVEAVVRTRRDLRTRLVEVEARALDDGILIAVEGDGTADTDAALGSLALEAADETEEAALLGPGGEALTATDGFAGLALVSEALAAIEDDETTVEGASGRHRVRLARLSDDPPRSIAVVEREAIAEDAAKAERRWFYRGRREKADTPGDDEKSDFDAVELLSTDPEAADEAPSREAAADEIEKDDAAATRGETEADDDSRPVGFLSRATTGVAAAALGAAGLVRTVRQAEEPGEADENADVSEDTAEALALNEAEGGTTDDGEEVVLADGSLDEGAADEEARDDLLALDGADEDDLAAAGDDSFVGAALYAPPSEPMRRRDDRAATAREEEGEPPFRFVRSERATRFAWSIDVDQRFDTVSPTLAETVGASCAFHEGETWAEATERLGIDTNGAIADLLERGDTWSGRTVMWPVEGENLSVPVDLAGLPAFDRDRAFKGFNGFGIVRTADAVPGDRGDEEDVAGDAGTDGEADAAPTRQTAAATVTPLRALSRDEQAAFESIGEKLGEETDAARETGDDGIDPLAFETPEPEALIDEIVEDDDDLEDEGSHDEVVASETDDEATGRVRVAEVRDVDTSILTRLPIPVLAYRADTLLFANAEFHRLTGYETLEALAEAGGIDALFEGEHDEADLASARLRDREGRRLHVEAHLQTVPWDHQRAMLLTLKREEGDDPDGPPGDGPDDDPDDGPDDEGPDDEGRSARRVPGVRSTSSRVRQVFGSVSKSPDASANAPSSSIAGRAHPLADMSPEALHDMLDTASDGILVLDADACVQAINRPAEALFGIEAADILEEPFLRLLAPESHRTALDYLAGLGGPGVASVLNDGREVIGRVGADLNDEDAGLLPLNLTIRPVGDGETFCAVVRDISQWRGTEEALVAARAEAERASREKSKLLATVSHEVRTPLNSIIGFADMMREERFGPLGSERYRGYARDIVTSGRHVLDIINDLLDISKIEAGEMSLDFASVGLNTVVTETVAMSQPQANGERIVIRTSLAANLPDVVADERSMRQVLLNLLANALAFTNAGGQVVVSTAYDDEDVVLRVRDTGIGMNEEEIEEALRPFGQVRGADRAAGSGKRDGTGLGLPLTKAMVEANRAQFAISSRRQEGTLVEIRFPPQRVLTH